MTETLCNAVRSRVKLHYARRDGTTLADHLQQVYKTTGEIDPLLVPPEIPPAGRLVYSHFWLMRSGDELTFGEIEAYSRLTGMQFRPIEIQLLRTMDGARAAEARRISKNA